MGRLERLKQRQPVVRGNANPTAQEVQTHIEGGGWHRHWSPTLSQWVWFVRDNRSLALLHTRYPDAVGYTLAEIQELVNQCCGSDELIVINNVKRELQGTSVLNGGKRN